MGAMAAASCGGCLAVLQHPWQAVFGREASGVGEGRGADSRRRSKEGQGTPASCPGDCLRLLTLCHVLCHSRGIESAGHYQVGGSSTPWR